jgi:hypothetical protein
MKKKMKEKGKGKRGVNFRINYAFLIGKLPFLFRPFLLLLPSSANLPCTPHSCVTHSFKEANINALTQALSAF